MHGTYPIHTQFIMNLSHTLSSSFFTLTSCMHICSHTPKYKSSLDPLASKEDDICPLGLFFFAVQQSRAIELPVSPGLKPVLSTSIQATHNPATRGKTDSSPVTGPKLIHLSNFIDCVQCRTCFLKECYPCLWFSSKPKRLSLQKWRLISNLKYYTKEPKIIYCFSIIFNTEFLFDVNVLFFFLNVCFIKDNLSLNVPTSQIYSQWKVKTLHLVSWYSYCYRSFPGFFFFFFCLSACYRSVPTTPGEMGLPLVVTERPLLTWNKLTLW